MDRKLSHSVSVKAVSTPLLSGLIFTDLDGTLLDENTYDFSPAAGALSAALACGVEVILCSSKTLPEMLQWQQRLNLAAPFITENGGGIFNNGSRLDAAAFTSTLHGLPVQILGATRLELCALLNASAAANGIACRGFNEMSIKEIASRTGLQRESALMAMNRDFDEPFVLLGDPEPQALERFFRTLEDNGCHVERGGRFWHLMAHSGKGAAVEWLLNAYAARYGKRPPSMALGDGENDLSMLRATDKGVVVRKHDGSSVAPPGQYELEVTTGIGPEGWCEAVEAWLHGLGEPITLK